jgi:dolichol-phosphate mannosyltransferase
MFGRRVLIILPAYNEGASLQQLLDKIVAAAQDIDMELGIVVCNDGSTDATAAILARRADAESRITILTHKINRGLGETVRDLFEHAAEVTRDEDVLVRMDCDDTHEPSYIPALIRKLDEGYDVVIASRFARGGGQLGVDGYRRFVSSAANLFMRVFFNVPNIHEYSCGFRAYRCDIIKRAIAFYGNDFIQLKGLGFTCTLEKLVKLHLLGARFAEVGFELRYDQKQSESKMVGSITTFGYLVMVVMYHWPWGGWRRAYRQRLPTAAATE